MHSNTFVCLRGTPAQGNRELSRSFGLRNYFFSLLPPIFIVTVAAPALVTRLVL